MSKFVFFSQSRIFVTFVTVNIVSWCRVFGICWMQVLIRQNILHLIYCNSCSGLMQVRRTGDVFIRLFKNCAWTFKDMSLLLSILFFQVYCIMQLQNYILKIYSKNYNRIGDTFILFVNSYWQSESYINIYLQRLTLQALKFFEIFETISKV